jgi:tripartite-type tricarboxylate transporter receptor subunit TctC
MISKICVGALTKFTAAIGLGVVLASSALFPAKAQFPEKPIRLVLGFGTGGNIDTLARIVADQLSKDLGKPVLVENKPGAGGNIAASYVAKTAPDGYTMLLGGTNYAIGPSWYKNLQFDLTRDFRVVTTLTRNSNVLVVNPASDLKTLDDVIKQARAQPNKLTFASSGAGTLVHLAGELFQSQAKIEMRHVPYNAVSPAELDIMGGRVNMMFDSLPAAQPFITDGRMRAIGVTSAKRSPFAPDVPTLSELGLKDYDASSWYAIWVPAAVQNDVVNKLNAAIDTALKNPDVQTRIKNLGGEIFNRSPVESDAFVREELRKWTSTIEGLGPRPN